jgi:hypothetical protein
LSYFINNNDFVGGMAPDGTIIIYDKKTMGTVAKLRDGTNVIINKKIHTVTAADGSVVASVNGLFAGLNKNRDVRIDNDGTRRITTKFPNGGYEIVVDTVPKNFAGSGGVFEQLNANGSPVSQQSRHQQYSQQLAPYRQRDEHGNERYVFRYSPGVNGSLILDPPNSNPPLPNAQPPAPRGTCGFSRFSSPLIVNGEPVQRGEYPWVVSLFVSHGERQKFVCGGTLLSSKHVATAAHCIELPNEPHRYTVMVGRHNIVDRNERGFQSRQVSRLTIHPDYQNRRQRADADIAILKLRQPVQFNDRVEPACLPKSSIEYGNVQGTVVGYGKSDNYEEHTTIPRKISVRAVNLVTCLYSDSAYVQIASSRNFCAAGAGSSPCKGDSGGGFYVRDASSGQWILYGVVSEGMITNGFCDVRKYVVFVDVTKFLRWIFQSE